MLYKVQYYKTAGKSLLSTNIASELSTCDLWWVAMV